MNDTNDQEKQRGKCPPMGEKGIRGIQLIQEKWILFIVEGLREGPLGFNELSRRARGVNTTTLSQRMDLLEKEGLVTKTICSTIPPRTSYELTEAGHALREVTQAIVKWSETYLNAEDESSPCCGEE